MNAEEIKSEIDSILIQIVEKYRPLKVILFGSAARENVEEINDFDFPIFKEDVPLHIKTINHNLLKPESLFSPNVAKVGGLQSQGV